MICESCLRIFEVLLMKLTQNVIFVLLVVRFKSRLFHFAEWFFLFNLRNERMPNDHWMIAEAVLDMLFA